MIARIWKARATPERAAEYATYLKTTVMPELAAIHGYQGVTLLERERDGAVEVTVMTWWDSLQSIAAFAGAAVETAVVHDTAARLLLDFDREVAHHDVVVDHRVGRHGINDDRRVL
jgi:heme-degrading monooxygenase HmoA